MQIGDEVILQKFSGKDAEEFDAFVIGVHGESINVAYFDKSQSAVLGGVDWRNAFARVDGVKHVDHEDVVAGKEGFAYHEGYYAGQEVEEVPGPAPVKAKGK